VEFVQLIGICVSHSYD